MNLLLEFFLIELVNVLVLLIVYLLLQILLMLKKTVVTVPSMALAITPVSPVGQYDIGATLNVTGLVLLDVGPPVLPAAGENIVLIVTDSKGNLFPGGSVASGPDGTYAGSFIVPAGIATGQATIAAADAKLNVTATATFSFSMRTLARQLQTSLLG